MASSNTSTLGGAAIDTRQHIAEQLRSLPQHLTSSGDVRPERAMMVQAKEAGRLLAEAVEAGAFAWSDHLREILAQSLADKQAVGYAGFWILVRQDWLCCLNRHHDNTMGSDSPPWQYTFMDDCRKIADAIAAECEDQQGPGPTPKVEPRRRGASKPGAKAAVVKAAKVTMLAEFLMANNWPGQSDYKRMREEFKKKTQLDISEATLSRYCNHEPECRDALSARTPRYQAPKNRRGLEAESVEAPPDLGTMDDAGFTMPDD